MRVHAAPVAALALHADSRVVVSADAKGVLEYWDADGGHAFPQRPRVAFRYKGETDLYELAKRGLAPGALATTPPGARCDARFVVTASDRLVRVFDLARGKLIRAFDESIGAFDRAHAAGGLRLDAIDFGRRAAVERELEGARVALSRSGAVFDETGHFLA